MKTEPTWPIVAAESEARAEQPRAGSVVRRLLKLSLLIGLPLVLVPLLLPRKLSANRLSSSDSAVSTAARASLLVREKKIQDLVDDFRGRLSIADTVTVSIVQANQLVVSVQRAKDGAGVFSLSIEEGFLDDLNGGELEAVVAHELGHVWIFTHHPYLQTEELANEIATRLVSQETLAVVYEKVWKRTGSKGNLVYLPSAASPDARGPDQR
jgi:hypothetical protein